jgi:hypothetical protein
MLAKDKESMMTGAVIRSANKKMKQNPKPSSLKCLFTSAGRQNLSHA